MEFKKTATGFGIRDLALKLCQKTQRGGRDVTGLYGFILYQVMLFVSLNYWTLIFILLTIHAGVDWSVIGRNAAQLDGT